VQLRKQVSWQTGWSRVGGGIHVSTGDRYGRELGEQFAHKGLALGAHVFRGAMRAFVERGAMRAFVEQ
jgi:hypothetical protein